MIGIDIEDISRFKNKNDAFYHRIFTQKEIDYCCSYKHPASHFAARFCAKEAVYKALSSFGIHNVLISNIEIILDKNNVPRVNFINTNIEGKVNVSLSHEKEKAIAVAMLCVEDFEKYIHHPCYAGDED